MTAQKCKKKKERKNAKKKKKERKIASRFSKDRVSKLALQ